MKKKKFKEKYNKKKILTKKILKNKNFVQQKLKDLKYFARNFVNNC